MSESVLKVKSIETERIEVKSSEDGPSVFIEANGFGSYVFVQNGRKDECVALVASKGDLYLEIRTGKNCPSFGHSGMAAAAFTADGLSLPDGPKGISVIKFSDLLAALKVLRADQPVPSE